MKAEQPHLTFLLISAFYVQLLQLGQTVGMSPGEDLVSVFVTVKQNRKCTKNSITVD